MTDTDTDHGTAEPNQLTSVPSQPEGLFYFLYLSLVYSRLPRTFLHKHALNLLHFTLALPLGRLRARCSPLWSALCSPERTGQFPILRSGGPLNLLWPLVKLHLNEGRRRQGNAK